MRTELIVAGFMLAAVLCLLPHPHAALAQDDGESTVISAVGNELLVSPAQLPPASETRDELKRLLALDEFDAEGQVQKESWLMRMWQKLQNMLSSNNVGGSSAWGVALAILLLALVVFLVVRLAWQFAARTGAGSAAAERRDPRAQSADQLLSAAALAAEGGDYRAAVRFRYLALLRNLNLPAATVLTNSQLTRRLAKTHPALQGAFGQLVAYYEDSWYGGLGCRQEEYTQAETLARDIEVTYTERSEDEAAH